jgi:hypothetical protein
MCLFHAHVAGERLESDILDLQVVLRPGLGGLGMNKDKDGLEQTENDDED